MPWANTIGRRYYYRSRRINGKVKRVYVGAGPIAELSASADDRDRAVRERRREEEKARQSWAQLEAGHQDEPVVALWNWVEQAARAALLAAGYHDHKRQWRKRRDLMGAKLSLATEETLQEPKPLVDPDGKPLTTEKIREALDQAEKGDKAAIPVLQCIMRQPGMADMLGGNLARKSQQDTVDRAAGKNLIFREAVTKKMEELREELAGGDPSPVEKLLVERIVLCWLQLHFAEILHEQTTAGAAGAAVLEFQQRRIQLLHRRYLASMRTLAVVRKLAMPVLQAPSARATARRA